MDFEMNYESNLLELRNDLVNWTYAISPSICFIIQDPAQREVFAADFRDRIIHHLIYNYIYEIFDNHFIYDSYSCRLEKWTHFGIKRLEHFLRSCTDNYGYDAYILKLDIKWFFMSIDKNILFNQIKTKLSSLINEMDAKQTKDLKNIDHDFLLSLIHQIIFHDPTQNCIIKWKKSDRNWLPYDKSLFYSHADTGLAIWNLTSQLFANIYLDSLDKYIKYQLWFKYYGRYVDDFIIIDTDKQKLLSSISQIKTFLDDKLHLTLHPKKIYFQHYAKWVQFLWAYIKPYRTYIRKRTIWNFWKRIETINDSLKLSSFGKGGEPRSGWGFKDNIQSIINSYLWILNHYKTYKIKKKLIKNFNNRFRSHFHFTKYYTKVIPNIRKLKSFELKNLYPQWYYNGNLR
jgi:hypothetical protein